LILVGKAGKSIRERVDRGCSPQSVRSSRSIFPARPRVSPGRKIGGFRARILLSHLAQSSGLRWRRQPQCPSVAPYLPVWSMGRAGQGLTGTIPGFTPKRKRAEAEIRVYSLCPPQSLTSVIVTSPYPCRLTPVAYSIPSGCFPLSPLLHSRYSLPRSVNSTKFIKSKVCFFSSSAIVRPPRFFGSALRS
jgi:hypothetical protein